MLCKPREESCVSGDVFFVGVRVGGKFLLVLFGNKHVRPFFFWGGGGGKRGVILKIFFGNDDGLMVGGVCLVCACQHH